MAIMSFIHQLRRRRVFRLAGIYLISTWLLLQIADVTFEPIGFSPWAMTALVWIVVVGFPVALLLSWRYDLTEQGLVRITAGGEADNVDLSLKPVDYLVLAGLLMIAAAVSYKLIDYQRQRSHSATALPELPMRPNAVAVLPFVNMGGEGSDDYFSDGVAEEILNALTRVSELRVVARTSSFAFKDQAIDIREIARRLGAQRIVEGSVRRAGDRLRITAQLIDAPSGTHLWSDTYDRQLGDVFEVQEDIAGQIVVAMRDELGAALSTPARAGAMTDSLEAYDRYLLGNGYFWQRGKEPVEKAIALYREALELDPEFAHAWAALAAAYNTARAHGAVVPGDVPLHELAAQAAERAIELDDTLGLAWMVLGAVKPEPRDYAGGASYLIKALEVSPREPTVIHWMAEAMISVGRLREALQYAELGYENDPMVPVRSGMLAWASLANGLNERAIRFVDQARELGLFDALIWSWGLFARLEAGDLDAAEAWLIARPTEVNPETIAAEEAYLAARRHPSPENIRHTVDVIMAAYLQEGGPRIDGNYATYLLVSLGAIDAAYEFTDRRLEFGANPVSWLFWLPSQGAFRADPRFTELPEIVRLPGFWRQFGWADACHPVGDSFACE